jgi:hypothetical protein
VLMSDCTTIKLLEELSYLYKHHTLNTNGGGQHRSTVIDERAYAAAIKVRLSL